MDYFNKEFFEAMGFTSEEENVYKKEVIVQRVQLPQGIFQWEKIIKFKVLDVHPELGTNIEYYEDNTAALTGYWTDHEDFKSTFK